MRLDVIVPVAAGIMTACFTHHQLYVLGVALIAHLAFHGH